MSFKLILVLLFVAVGCTEKRTPKDHLSKVTLKLEKSVDIKLTKEGKGGTDFNINASIQSQSPIISAEVQWIVINPDNQRIIQRSEIYNGPSSNFSLNSNTITVSDPDKNHKIVFIFKGKTELEDIHKTEIYNSLIQEDLNEAVKKLEERGRF